ncbi:hypothetical protein DFH27DRAFT_604098 [Peziza echinospora]|nr:hypothetical protein DFH27DRAFT_604098 [Peziza echinospora]
MFLSLVTACFCVRQHQSRLALDADPENTLKGIYQRKVTRVDDMRLQSRKDRPQGARLLRAGRIVARHGKARLCLALAPGGDTGRSIIHQPPVPLPRVALFPSPGLAPIHIHNSTWCHPPVRSLKFKRITTSQSYTRFLYFASVSGDNCSTEAVQTTIIGTPNYSWYPAVPIEGRLPNQPHAATLFDSVAINAALAITRQLEARIAQNTPTFIVLMGASGTGKSTAARVLTDMADKRLCVGDVPGDAEPRGCVGPEREQVGVVDVARLVDGRAAAHPVDAAHHYGGRTAEYVYDSFHTTVARTLRYMPAFLMYMWGLHVDAALVLRHLSPAHVTAGNPGFILNPMWLAQKQARFITCRDQGQMSATSLYREMRAEGSIIILSERVARVTRCYLNQDVDILIGARAANDIDASSMGKVFRKHRNRGPMGDGEAKYISNPTNERSIPGFQYRFLPICNMQAILLIHVMFSTMATPGRPVQNIGIKTKAPLANYKAYGVWGGGIKICYLYHFEF